jgi:hypothetical protein
MPVFLRGQSINITLGGTNGFYQKSVLVTVDAHWKAEDLENDYQRHVLLEE